MYCRHAKENRIQLSEYKDCNRDLQPLQHTKNITQHNVGEVFVIPRRIWWVGKIGSSAPSSQIPTKLCQKALTGVLFCWCNLSTNGVWFHGPALATRFILLRIHILTSQPGGVTLTDQCMHAWSFPISQKGCILNVCLRTQMLAIFKKEGFFLMMMYSLFRKKGIFL